MYILGNRPSAYSTHHSWPSEFRGSVATLVVHHGHVRNQLDDAAHVAPLVVVPRDELDKVGVQRDPSSSAEDGRVRVTHKVGRDDCIVRVAEDALWNLYDSAPTQLRRRE